MISQILCSTSFSRIILAGHAYVSSLQTMTVTQHRQVQISWKKPPAKKPVGKKSPTKKSPTKKTLIKKSTGKK